MKTFVTTFVKRILGRPSLVSGLMVILFVTFVYNYAISRSGGITGRTQKNGVGCTCHCANTDNTTTVTIATTATTFKADSIYTFTVTVSSSNALQTKGGCNIAVDRGTLTAVTNLKSLNDGSGELTHTAPQTLQAVFTFTYTAPHTGGTDVIYATGNAVNGDGINGNGTCTDKWNNATNFTLSVIAPVRTLSVTRSTIAFGKVRTGTSTANDTLRLVSTGDSPITISSSAMNNTTPFSASPLGGNRLITNGQAEVNTISFNPSTKGSYTDTFVVNTNATVAADVRKTVIVTGQAVKATFVGNAAMDFGNVKVGTTKDIVYTFQNTGDDTLFLSQPTLTNAGFTLTTPLSPLVYPPNASGSITVRFSPTVKQNYQTTLTFAPSNGVLGQAVAITGVGSQAQLSIAPSFDVGNVKVITAGSNNFAISNSGNDDLIVSSISIDNGQQSGKFSLQGSTSFTLAGGKSSQLIINYNPTVEQQDTATLTIQSNDPTTPTKQMQIFGRGVVPIMVVTPRDTINFGDVKVGAIATNAQAIIQNQGQAILGSIATTSSTSQFAVANPPSQIQPASSLPLTIKFSPTAVGIVTGFIVIAGDDAKNPDDTVFVKGRGTTSKVDLLSSIDFGNLQITKFKDTTVKIRNLGTAPVKIIKYSMNDPKGVFVLTDSSKHTIPANDSITFSLRFTANQELTYVASLTIITDESSGGNHVISLSGVGVNSKLVLDNASLDFGQVDTMTVETQQIKITNTGSAATTITSVKIEGSTAFTIAASVPFTLAPSASMTLSINFSPRIVRDESATLRITASEGSPLTAALHGTGKAVITGAVGRSAEAGAVSISLYPNPAQSMLNIQASAEKDLVAVMEVLDANGKVVKTGISWMLTPHFSQQQMNINDLPSGEYFLRMVTRSGNSIGGTKFIISH